MGEVHDLVRRATDMASGSIENVAERAGLSRETVHDWRQGRRNPRPRNLRALAGSLQLQAGKLTQFSEELEEMADQREGPPEDSGESPEEQEEIELTA